MKLFIDLHRKSAKEDRSYFTNLLKVLCKIVFVESLSVNMRWYLRRGLHSENKRSVLKYVILRQAKNIEISDMSTN